jgi:hypothetical protein
LLALNSYAVSSRVVLKCKDSLQKLALSNRVRLVWVPGHCGIHENEEADALARAGSSSAFVGRSFVFRWHLRVSGRGSGSGYLNHTTSHGAKRLRLKKPNPGLLRLPRSKLRIFVGLVTGHCPLNKHLHNMGLRDEPIYIACGMEDESDISRNALFFETDSER